MSSASDFVIENGVLIKYVGTGGDVVVPEGVTEIGANAFNISNIIGFLAAPIRSVTFPNGLRSIGGNAFCGCSGIREIILPDGVESIGYKAFNLCSGLSSVSVPDSVTDVGANAMKDTKWLRNQSADMAFFGKVCIRIRTGETELSVPAGTVGIAAEALQSGNSLQKVMIPASVRSIGNRAFAGCASLETVYIHGNPLFGKDCFPKNTVVCMENVLLDELKNATLKRQAAFGYCICSEPLPENVYGSVKKYLSKNVGELIPFFCERRELLIGTAEKRLFDEKQLDGLLERFPDDVEIRALLLKEKQALVPKQVQRQRKTNPIKLPTAAELKKLWKTDGLPDGTLELTLYKGDETEIYVPASIGKKAVKRIGKKCFAAGNGIFSAEDILSGKVSFDINPKLAAIRKVALPEGIESIGDYALCDCVNLADALLPSTLQRIDRYVFRSCAGLTELEIPGAVVQVGEGAFSDCIRLTTVRFNIGITKLESYLFYGCAHLNSVFLPQTVTAIGDGCFEGCNALTIHAPAGSYAEQYAKENNIPFVAE